MATKLTSKQEKLTAWAMGQAGIDLLTTPISNAWLHKGQKAGLVQGLIEQKDGMEAAAMRLAAAEEGDGPPAAVKMVLAGEMEVNTPELHQMMMQWSPQYQSEATAAQEKHQADYEKQMEANVEASQRARMGDAGYEKAQKIEAQRQVEADKASLFERSYQEERQRLARQQQQQQSTLGANN